MLRFLGCIYLHLVSFWWIWSKISNFNWIKTLKDASYMNCMQDRTTVFLFLKQTNVVGTQGNGLNEMVLYSTRIIR